MARKQEALNFLQVNLNDSKQSRFVRDYLLALHGQNSWIENAGYNEQLMRDRRYVLGVIELLDECAPYAKEEAQ